MLKLLMYFLLVFNIMFFSSEIGLAQSCDYWFEVVGVENVDYSGKKVNEKDPEQIIKGMECLLKLKGDKSPGSLSGATHNGVSQLLPSAAVEVTALHYITYLFYGRYDYANGVALHEEDKPLVLNSNKVVKKAYKSYKKWFKKVKKIGIKKAKELKLDPLEGSGITWY